jgi:hypothetical protein
VHLAETELFRWQASDDLVHPEYTARCIAALDPDPLVVLAYCRTMFIDAQGAELGPYEDRLHAVDDSPRKRFHQVYQNLVKVNALYGVMRRATLLRTQLMPSYERGDMAFLYELALYGKFVEIPDRLFLRRMHPQNMGSLSAPELRMVWSPQRWRRPSFASWHMLATLERAILRGPLTVRERALLQVDLAREAASRGFRRRLVREAVEGVSYAVNRARTPLRRAPASGVS